MNEPDIKLMLDILGVPYTAYSKNIAMPCLLARWTHKGGTDSSPSMSIKINTEGHSVYNCFACKNKGTLTGLIMVLNAHYGGKYSELENWVMQGEVSLGYEGLARGVIDAYKEKNAYVPPKKINPKNADQYLGAVPKYILDRGITLETCKVWKLGYDCTAGRVVFPIYDWVGALCGMVGRSLDNSAESRYYNYWNFSKSQFLYGEHLFDATINQIVVVEGMISTLAMYQSGIHNVMGLMGSKLSNAQKRKLQIFDKIIYIATDMDKEGRQCRIQMKKELGKTRTLLGINLPCNDPADCSADELRLAVEEAEYL